MVIYGLESGWEDEDSMEGNKKKPNDRNFKIALTNTNALNILTSHVVIASPMGAAISFFMGLLRRYAPRKDKPFIAFVLISLRILQGRGINPSLSDQGSLGLVYGEVIKQASMLSFNDAFYLLSIMMMLILPLVLLMKKRKNRGSRSGDALTQILT